MDFATSEVHIFSYDPNVWESGEHFLTKHFSEEGQPFKESKCQWMIIDLENNFIAEYNSASEASKKTLTRCSCITQCVNPKYNRTTANNFIWKRKEIYG